MSLRAHDHLTAVEDATPAPSERLSTRGDLLLDPRVRPSFDEPPEILALIDACRRASRRDKPRAWRRLNDARHARLRHAVAALYAPPPGHERE